MQNTWTLGALAAIIVGVVVALGVFSPAPSAQPPDSSATSSPVQSATSTPATPSTQTPASAHTTVVGYWECLPKKGPGPHTMECAFGIAVDQSDGHYGVAGTPARYAAEHIPTGSKVRVVGEVKPAPVDTSYDIDGILWATSVEKL